MGGGNRDQMVVGFTTTYMQSVVSSNPAHGEMFSMHHYLITFVSDLQQVSGFSEGTPIKLIA
jgi:hypothetical protein